MQKYALPPLSASAKRGLASLQGRVNSAGDRIAQAEAATRLFKNKNNATFREVRSVLAKRGPADEACYYCERDRWRDIEHIRPKTLFPRRAFRWSNYIYACAICNQDRKKDHFAVIVSSGAIVHVRADHPSSQPIPAGIPAFIDIRREDPMHCLRLELHTGRLVPIGSPIQQERGRYTRDLLELDADALTRARRMAFEGYQNYFEKLEDALSNLDFDRGERIAREIFRLPYPTIRAELARQAFATPQFRQWLESLFFAIGV